jgi:hypothetical protein
MLTVKQRPTKFGHGQEAIAGRECLGRSRRAGHYPKPETSCPIHPSAWDRTSTKFAAAISVSPPALR